MTQLAAAMFFTICLPLVGAAQDPKPPATELEGTWREPLLPGEKAADKFTITFAGDQITISTGKDTYAGAFRIEGEITPTRITITLDTVDGQLVTGERTYTGKLWVASGQLNWRVDLYPVRVARVRLEPGDNPDQVLAKLQMLEAEADRDRMLGLAPVTRTLGKVQK